MQTTIVRWGNSRGVRLPKLLLETARLADNDLVDVVAEDGQIIIKKSEEKRKHIPLSERLKAWNGKPYEILDEDKQWLEMKPAGDEEW